MKEVSSSEAFYYSKVIVIMVNMELKDFISKTLTEIAQGVDDANAISKRFELSGQMHHATGKSGETIEFDVALTSGDESKVNGKVGAGIKVLGASVDGSLTENAQTAHRLHFKVFVLEKPRS